ncbi:MAG: HD domain-containing protein [Acidobacteria bacterium]|nr:HD domain-containing protein [Acidobacteriota bacterium]
MVARLSVSEPFVFASAMLFGPAAGTVTVAIDACVMSLRLMPSLRTPHRILFNVGTLVVSVAVSAVAFFKLAGIDPRAPHYPSVDTFIWPLYVFTTLCFVLNSGLVALALSIERRASAFAIWRQQFMWLSVNYFAGASVAALLVVYARTVDAAILGVVIPLIAILYLTFRTTLGRLDDANKHLSEVNSLYLSTIETLAMAIDAKDQVTHGHIRRVQRFAVGLAKALGVSDDRQLRAIEAAALLHDMGKLAIPEFILNKPGKLTTREFSVMKTHAAVGADLLSSIQFPYPVVPIVRHHHENWDGSGYPDGIRGSDIPLGARILSVVDCYDALTSDRPYRPAMSPEDALDILSQRRGKMYDPLVVDAFIRDHVALCAGVELRDIPALILANQAETHAGTQPSASDISTVQLEPIESLRLIASLSPFPEGAPLPAICRQIVDSLRTIASFDTATVFLLDDDSSDAEAVFAAGSVAQQVAGIRIPIAERLTGWVAAHRTAVWNSDAALDLASVASGASLTLGSSLPLSVGDALIGVLSLYGRSDQEVTVGQRRALESLLPAISASLGAAAQRPGIAIDCADEPTRQAATSALDAVLSHERGSSSGRVSVIAVNIAHIASDTSRPERLELAAIELSALLSPYRSRHRCVIRLSNNQFLLCALDDANADVLEAEVERAGKHRALSAVRLLTTRLNSALDLQDRIRKIADGSSATSIHGPMSRIH